MDLMDDELRRVLAGGVEPQGRMETEIENEMRRLRMRDASRAPSASELETASRPAFRMSSAGGRRPETQRGGGEAIDTLMSGFAGSIPAGLAGAAVLPFQGPEGASRMVEKVQDYLTLEPQTEGGVRAFRGIAGALSPMGAPAQYLGDATLRATGSPLAATAAEVLLDPLNLMGTAALAKAAPRAAAAAGRGAAKAGKATVESLGPKAAEMAEAYMRRAGMMPDIFIGKSAKTWDAASNARAMEMEKAGANPRDIWSQTGNWRAPDGQWRQEISDVEARFTPDPQARTVADVLSHPELFRAYPELQSMRMTMDPTGQSSYSAGFGVLPEEITLGRRADKKTALHEVQHPIQEREGFGAGANPNMFEYKFEQTPEQRAAFNAFANLSEKLGGPTGLKPSDMSLSGDVYEFTQSISDKLDFNARLSKSDWSELRESAKAAGLEPPKSQEQLWMLGEDIANALNRETIKSEITPTQQYLRTPGEAEARAVEARAGMTAEQRRATFPEESYDVPISELRDVGRQGPTTALATTYQVPEQRLPKTDTPAFKEFTGGAPLVKAENATKHEFQTGNPVVIEGYHGTLRDYSEVDPAKSSAGYFTTSRPSIADEYAGVYPDTDLTGGSSRMLIGGNVQRQYVRMDNPLVINARGANWSRIDTRGVPGYPLPMSNTDAINQWAKQSGYDGVIYKDLRDSMSAPSGRNAPVSNVYASFKPNYVKSAIGNRGTFDVRQNDMTKAQGGPVESNMSYTGAADIIADKLVRQGMDADKAFSTALRMSEANMKAGGAVLMAAGGQAAEDAAMSATRSRMDARWSAENSRPSFVSQYMGPNPNRQVINGRAVVSREELADFQRKFGADKTLRDLLNADRTGVLPQRPSELDPRARGPQGVNVAPVGPRRRPDEAAIQPSVGLSDIPGLIMQGMKQGAERVPFGRGAGAAFVGAGMPRAAAQALMGPKLLRENPAISPERQQALKEMEDYISGLNRANAQPMKPRMRALEERIDPPDFAKGGKVAPGISAGERAATRAAERLAAKKAAEEARTPIEKSVVEKFGQKQEQEAARAKKVEQQSQAVTPPREVKPAGRRAKVAPDVYRVMAENQGDEAVLRAAKSGEHLRPTQQGYVGSPRTVTSPQGLGAMRRSMDKDFIDAVEAVRLADPERLGTWYDRAKQGIAESSEPYQLPRTLEQHGVYSAGVSPESELGFALKHLNSRVAGEPGMAYRGAPMRNLDEAVAQNRPANMGFKIGEYMNKNDPRIPNEGLFGVNDFRRAQGMGYTDPSGKPWKAGVSETMHPFMDAETALQVNRANTGAVGGRTDWAGPHIQEVPWVYGKGQDLYSRGKSGRFGGDELEGIKRSLVEANNTARDYMYKHAASATHEAVPGASLGHVPQVLSMTPEQKAAYGATGRWDMPAPEMALSDMPGVGAGNRDVLYGALGYRQLPSREGSGLYINSLGGVETNPMTIARPLMDFPTGGGGLMAPLSRKTMEATEGLRALLDAQEAGAFNLPNTMAGVKNKTSMVLDTRGRGANKLGDPSAGVLPTSEQLALMNDVMADTGFGVSATNRGAVVFPYDPLMDPKEAAKILKSKQKELTSIFPSSPERSMSTMGYVPGVGKRGQYGPEATSPYSGEATIDKLTMLADLPQDVARSLGESEAVRAQTREKALRDAKLGGSRGDIQETRRFFSEADWPLAVEMIRKGMSPAAALAALGYSASSMAEQAP